MPTILPEVQEQYLKSKGIDPSKFQIADDWSIVPRPAPPKVPEPGLVESTLHSIQNNLGSAGAGVGAGMLLAPFTEGMSIPAAAAIQGIGSLLASMGGGWAQKKVGLTTPEEQQAREHAAHPYATLAGSVAPMLLGGKPSLDQLKNLSSTARAVTAGRELASLLPAEKMAIANAAVNTGIQGGMLGKKVLSGEHIDPLEEAVGFTTPFLLKDWRDKGHAVNRAVNPFDATPINYIPQEAGRAPMIPERLETIEAQRDLALADGPKGAVYITKDSPTPKDMTGLAKIRSDEEGDLWINPNKYTDPAELARLKDLNQPVNGRDLGYFNQAKPTESQSENAVVISTSVNGVPDVISEVVPNYQPLIDATIAHHSSSYPGGETRVVSPEQIAVERMTVRPDVAEQNRIVAEEEAKQKQADEMAFRQKQKEQVAADKFQEAERLSKAKKVGKLWEDLLKGKEEGELAMAKEQQAQRLEQQKRQKEQVASDLYQAQQRISKSKKTTKLWEDLLAEKDAANAASEQLQAEEQAAVERRMKEQVAADREAEKVKVKKNKEVKGLWEDLLAQKEAGEAAVEASQRKLAEESSQRPVVVDQTPQMKQMASDPTGELQKEWSNKLARAKQKKNPPTMDVEGTATTVKEEPKGLPESARLLKGAEEVQPKETMPEGKAWDYSAKPAKGKLQEKTLAERQAENDSYQLPIEGRVPLKGKKGTLEKLLNFWQATGGQAQVFNEPTFSTVGDPILRYGKENIPGIEVNKEYAGSTGHEMGHTVMRESPNVTKRLVEHPDIIEKAKVAGVTPEEYVADLFAEGLINRVENNDPAGFKELFNTLKYHMGSTDPKVLMRMLENTHLTRPRAEGGKIEAASNVGARGLLDKADPATAKYSNAIGSLNASISTPEGRDAMERAQNERTRLRGVLGSELIDKLNAYPLETIKRVLKAHEIARNTGRTPSLTGDEATISNILRNSWKSVKQLQNESNYNRDIVGTEFYHPEVFDTQSKELLKKGIGDEKVKEIIKAIGDHWAAQGHEDPYKSAEDYVLGLSGAKFGAVDVDREGFGALRKAKGMGLPESSPSGIPIRERDPLSAISRYRDQAAADMAWQREVTNKLTPEQLTQLKSEKDGGWQKAEELYWNQDRSNNPTVRAASGLAGSLALGPMTKGIEIATNPQNAMAVGAGLGDVLKATGQLIGNYKKSYDATVKGGLINPTHSVDNLDAGRTGVAGTLSKINEVLGNYTGKNFLERVSRVYSYMLGQATAETRLRNGDAKWFKERGVDINDPQAVDKAATQMAEMIQGRRDSRELPAVMLKGPLADVAAIHRWAVGHSANLLTEIKQGNYSNLVGYMAAGLGVGVGRNLLNQFITGRKGGNATLDELQATGMPTGESLSALTNLLRSAGMGGAVTDLADYMVNRFQGKNTQILYNPLATALNSNLLNILPQFAEAVNKGMDPVDVAKLLGENILRSQVQVLGIAGNLLNEHRQEMSDARDLRVFEHLTEDKPYFSGTTNPALADENRQFKYAKEPDEVQAIFDKLAKRGNTMDAPDNYVMPSNPIDRMSYLDYLERVDPSNKERKESVGMEVEGANRMKSALIRGSGLTRRNKKLERLMSMAGQ